MILVDLDRKWNLGKMCCGSVSWDHGIEAQFCKVALYAVKYGLCSSSSVNINAMNSVEGPSIFWRSSLLPPHIPGLNLLKHLSDVESQTDPVLNINDHATGGRRTKDILGGPKGWGPKKKVANIEIYVIFEVFAFCGGRTKTDFKDRALKPPWLYLRQLFRFLRYLYCHLKT